MMAGIGRSGVPAPGSGAASIGAGKSTAAGLPSTTSAYAARSGACR